jgi:hypothetical protein
MAKVDEFNRLFTKTPNGICALETGKNFIWGERSGKGVSIFAFEISSVTISFLSNKTFLNFLNELQKELGKYGKGGIENGKN